jgi:hypothetical protein
MGCPREPALEEGLEPPGRAPTQAASSEFELAPGSRVEISFGNYQRRVQGQLDVVSGQLYVDPLDLATTRGSFRFDLLSLRLQAALAENNAPPRVGGAEDLTEQSLRWLQVADPEQPQLRYARFSILGIGALSASSAGAGEVIPSADSGMTSRRVRLRATGDLELHASRIPYTVALTATFSWPEAAPSPAAPTRIEVASADTLAVDLIRHGIVPRDARGEVLAETLAEMRQPPAKEARVTARWIAWRTSLGTATGRR